MSAVLLKDPVDLVQDDYNIARGQDLQDERYDFKA